MVATLPMRTRAGTADGSAGAGAAASPLPSRPGRRPASGRRQPGWPLAVAFVGFPLWWLLGLHEVVALAMTVPMVLDLIRRPRIVVPRGFFLWMLFLAWVVAGVMVLQVDAPYAVPGDSSARYVTWAYRLGWYLFATVAFLYVANNRQLSSTRICRILGWMFITVASGGLIATAFPHLDFPSLFEMLLPNSVANQGFVNSIVHPTWAQIQSIFGYEAPRPSAPFTFANIWGLNFAVLLPFFLQSWLGPDAGWRKPLAPFVLILAAIPVIYASNRGQWAALAVMGVAIALRAALAGRPGLLVGITGGALVGVMLLALSPLGTMVQARLSGENHTSNTGRTNLGTTALKSVAEKAPLTGYGTTREVQGNFNSIAGGESALCPRCSPPSFGTQGQFSLVVFSQGFVGALLYVGFFVMMFFRHLRSRAPTSNMTTSVLIAGFVTMPVYNSLGTGLVFIMIATALNWREDQRFAAEFDDPSQTLEEYARRVGRNSPVVVACLVVGAGSGVAWQQWRGIPATASVSMFVPRESAQIEKAEGRLSPDTLGQLALSGSVRLAARGTDDERPGTLAVSATPNTQILHLSYTAANDDLAVTAVTAAQQQFLERHAVLIRQRRLDQVAALQAEIAVTRSDLSRVNATLVRMGEPPSPRGVAERKLETKQRRDLESRIFDLQQQIVPLTSAPNSRGRQVQALRVKNHDDLRLVAATSGALVGLLGGLGLMLLRESRGRRIRRPNDVTEALGLPVLAILESGEARPAHGRDPAAEMLRPYRPEAFLVADTDGLLAHDAQMMANRLDAATHRRHIGGGVGASKRAIVVVGAGTRIRSVERISRHIDAHGASLIGAVFMIGRTSRGDGAEPETRPATRLGEIRRPAVEE